MDFLSDMTSIHFAIIFAIILYAVVLIIFPRLKIEKIGQAGKNTPFVAIVDPRAPYRAAHMAQEWKEARMKLFPPMLIWRVFHESGKRYLELMGHECEVQAVMLLYNRDQEQYRRLEARKMKDWYSAFDNWTAKKIERKMAKRSGKANRWVKKRLEDFKK